MKVNHGPLVVLGVAAITVSASPLAPRVLAQESDPLVPAVTTEVLDEAEAPVTAQPLDQIELPTTSVTAQALEEEEGPPQPRGFQVGRATQGGPSYIGVGINLGTLGDSALGDTSFAVVSKVGLSEAFSVRPGVVTNFTDDATFLLPLTYDFVPLRFSTSEQSLKFAPYVGGGVAITTDGETGLLLTGGLDVPVTSRWTVTANANAGFLDDVDVSVVTAVGYNF